MSTPPDQDQALARTIQQVPTCYRHPGRETYVSCVRCGRYACPDCMRSASVGQQCVECIGQAAAGQRGPGPPSAAAAGAIVTWALVAVNVAVFLVTWVRPSIVTNLEMLGYAAYGSAARRTVSRRANGTG